MLSLLACPDPDCGAPAEVLDTAVLASTDGPVRHLRVLCVRRHVFFLPEAAARQPRRSDLGLHR